ncbi:MAG: ABC transporter permease [Acidimicrobiia bacterium]|nr:ABC transporter permease [Acidimicrobiia bacterium]
MSGWSAIKLVAARDFKERIASRAFQLSTGLTVLLVVGFILVPTFIDTDGTQQWTIGVVGDVPAGLAETVEAGAGDMATVATSQFGSRAVAEAALEDGAVDIVVDAEGSIIVNAESSDQLTTLVAAVLASLDVAEQAAELGIDAAALTDLFSGTYDVESLSVEPDSTDSDRAFAFFATIILFMSIITYGSWILIGVIEEKTNRVVEVVLGTVRPHQLLTGKVLGIGILGVAQIVLIGVVAIVVLSLQDALDVPDAAGKVLVWAFIWYVLGFAFYAVAYAAAGSLVSRQEEAQNAAFPLTLMLMAAYFVASFSITGDNPVLRIASLLPMFAPMTMPLRIAGGDALAWEVAVSLILMVVVTYGLVRFAGRVYAGGLLQSGSRVKWREAFRASEA